MDVLSEFMSAKMCIFPHTCTSSALHKALLDRVGTLLPVDVISRRPAPCMYTRGVEVKLPDVHVHKVDIDMKALPT